MSAQHSNIKKGGDKSMHMIIRAIVYAKDKDEAIEKGRYVFEQLTEGGHPFDYYHMFDDEGTSVSGKGRWGDIPAAVKADSKKGKELIEEGMKYTREEFMRAVKYIRGAVEKYTDEELFEDQNLKVDDLYGGFRYNCYIAGKYEGADIFMYDEDAQGIRSQHDLDDVLNKYQSIYDHNGQENPNKDLDIWVVPTDVHY